MHECFSELSEACLYKPIRAAHEPPDPRAHDSGAPLEGTLLWAERGRDQAAARQIAKSRHLQQQQDQLSDLAFWSKVYHGDLVDWLRLVGATAVASVIAVSCTATLTTASTAAGIRGSDGCVGGAHSLNVTNDSTSVPFLYNRSTPFRR